MSTVAENDELGIKDLLEFGFAETKPQPDEGHDRQFWFTAKDEVGKMWQVLVRFWRLSKYGDHARDGFDLVLMVEVDGVFLRITRSIDVPRFSAEEVVDWCDGLWRKLKPDYLSLWEES